MDRFGQVADLAAHFDGQYGFGDQFAGARADHAAAEQTFGFGVDQPLGQALGAPQCLGPPAGRPGVDRPTS